MSLIVNYCSKCLENSIIFLIFSGNKQPLNSHRHMSHLKSFGRMELAILYSPHTTPRHAWRRLRDWMSSHPTLLCDLAATGYTSHQRSFTPAQVALIFTALGEP